MYSKRNISISILIISIVGFCFIYNGCGSKEVKRSKDYINAGMYSEAIELLTMEVQQNPKNAEAQHLLGFAHLLINREDDANVFFHRAELLNKDYIKKQPQTYFDAASQSLSKDTRLSLHYFRKAIEKNPNFREKASKQCFDKAKYFLQESDNNEIGIHLLKEALRFDPNQSETIYSYCMNTANEKIKANNLGIALSLLALITDTKYIKDKNAILKEMAIANWRNGNRSIAEHCFIKLIEAGERFEDNDSLFYAYYIDLVDSKIKDETYSKFIKLFPKSAFIPEILWKRAQYFFDESDINKSKDYLRQLSEKYSGTEYGLKAKEVLTK